jgi:glycosyltransferase involved in cell wall biosynthesis
MAELYASHLRKSDQHSSLGVDQFVANSSFVARRIKSYYRRDSIVIHPPVHTEQFSIRPDIDDYYVFAGELRGYKCANVAIEACNRLKRRLKIIGSGASADLVRSAGPLVEFLGRLPDDAYRTTLARARALLFPGVEDFGIIPVEAMASGRPVIARGKGGAMDTVVHGETGILYDEPTVEGLMAGMLAYEAEERSFRPELCRQQSQRFDHATFTEKFSKLLPGS